MNEKEFIELRLLVIQEGNSAKVCILTSLFSINRWHGSEPVISDKIL